MLQAKIFMPTNHLCVGPWIYDQQTVDITKKFSSLHLKYSELIIERFKLTTVRGDPVNPPIWWLDPEDSIAHTITDRILFFFL